MAARGLENAPLVALAERGPRELHEEQRSPSAQVRLMLVSCACRVESYAAKADGNFQGLAALCPSRKSRAASAVSDTNTRSRVYQPADE